jgi:plasmid stabilization system protein ParE
VGAGEGEDDDSRKEISLIITREAEADLLETFAYYEEQEAGLGTEFSRAADACIQAIVRSPKAYQIVHNGIRRAALRRFPYSVFFVLNLSSVVVVGCLHASRHPKEWRRRG